MVKDNKYNVIEIYENNLKELEKCMITTNIRPSEKKWNQYAVKNGYLSSKSMGYLCGIGFNKLCRKLMIEIHSRNKKS